MNGLKSFQPNDDTRWHISFSDAQYKYKFAQLHSLVFTKECCYLYVEVGLFADHF